MDGPAYPRHECSRFWNEIETGIAPVRKHNHPETCCNRNQPAHTSQNRTRIDKHLLLQLVQKMCSHWAKDSWSESRGKDSLSSLWPDIHHRFMEEISHYSKLNIDKQAQYAKCHWHMKFAQYSLKISSHKSTPIRKCQPREQAQLCWLSYSIVIPDRWNKQET